MKNCNTLTETRVDRILNVSSNLQLKPSLCQIFKIAQKSESFEAQINAHKTNIMFLTNLISERFLIVILGPHWLYNVGPAYRQPSQFIELYNYSDATNELLKLSYKQFELFIRIRKEKVSVDIDVSDCSALL